MLVYILTIIITISSVFLLIQQFANMKRNIFYNFIMNPTQTVPPSGQNFPNYNVPQQQPMYPQQGYPQMQMMPPKKNNSVLILVIVLILILILVGGGIAVYFLFINKSTGGNSNTTTTTTTISTTSTSIVPTTISGYSTYTNSANGFSFQYPSSWTKTLNPTASQLVVVYNSYQNVRANVITENLNSTYSLDEYVVAARNSLDSYNPTNFVSSNVTINGLLFKKFSYNFSGNYAEQYLTVVGMKAYILSVVAEDKSTYSLYSEEIGNIVNTFRIQQ